jgi:3-oxoadipate enol-lactonase
VEEALELYVERAGSGAPVVLAHGFGGSARNFRKQGRALADRYTLIGYDARGHGRSPSPRESEAYTTAQLVGDLARVVETTAVPAVVGGLSLGAFTALTYALGAQRPPRAVVVASYPAP